MKLVYVARARVPSRAAHSIHIMKMCQAFAASAHDVNLLVPDFPDCEPDVGDAYTYYGVSRSFGITRLPWRPHKGGDLVTSYRAATLSRRLGVELVYGRYLEGCLVAALHGLRVVFEIHNGTEQFPPHKRYMLASLLRCKQLQRLVVISEALKQYFVQRHRVSPDRILVAHDGADLPTECEPLPLGDSARLRVGYVGHLDPGKGTDVIHRLAMLCPFAHFHLIGGRTEDISAWRVRTGGVDNMTFHGFVEPGQVERYRKAMDVLLVPYQKSVLIQGRLDTAQWMSPLKVFEYMASRRPMVISDLPVLREVVNERNAIIVPPDDMDQWRQALVRLRDPALRQRVADAAYADFVAHHTWHQRAQSVLRGL